MSAEYHCASKISSAAEKVIVLGLPCPKISSARRRFASLRACASEGHLRDHLSDGKDIRLNDIKRSMCRERREEITDDHGPYPADQVLCSLRAAYNFALKTVDDPTPCPATRCGRSRSTRSGGATL